MTHLASEITKQFCGGILHLTHIPRNSSAHSQYVGVYYTADSHARAHTDRNAHKHYAYTAQLPLFAVLFDPHIEHNPTHAWIA